MTGKLSVLAAGAAMVAMLSGPGLAQQDFELENVILDTTSLWRYRMIWETEEVRLDSGEVGHLAFVRDRRTKEVRWDKVPPVVLPANTPPDWMKPEFDDTSWGRFRGPFSLFDIGIKNLCLRGAFEVKDPEWAGDQEVRLAFYGGVVVYLNGEELGRGFMPAGKITLATPATPYPREVYVGPEGFILTRYETRKYADRFKKRTRRFTLKIPARKLLKGVNVLAVSVHRPPADHVFYSHRIKAFAENGVQSRDATWGRLALDEVKLIAPPGSNIVPNFSRPKGFQLWNQSAGCKVFTADYAGPREPLRPIRIVGVRNGLFPGQVVVGSTEPICDLKVQVSDLKGPGTIPGAAVTVRYALPDGVARRWASKLSVGAPFDTLDETVPGEVPVREDGAGAVQPIWLNVKVPADAAPGDYTGRVTVSADPGAPGLPIPLKLKVYDWTMPDSTDFVVRPDIFQSPDSVAMRYGVAMWSEEHWALLEKTLELFGQMSVKSLYITGVRRTHLGNEHSMFYWTRRADGTLDPDFRVAERYLDTAIRHMGKVPRVVLYCWEPPYSGGHAGFGPGRTHDREILISVLDPDTGELTKEQGPRWNTPQCRRFWIRTVGGWQRILEKRGMIDSLAFGMVGDHRPTKKAMDDICAVAPKAPWAVHSHHYCDLWQGYPAAYCAAVWGIGARVVEPEDGLGYGWLNKFWLASYPRALKLGSPLPVYRAYTERFLGAVPGDYHYWRAEEKAKGTRGIKGVSGIGRIGGDFWKVITDSRGNWRSNIVGRYPETAWGQLSLNCSSTYLLGPGAKGPAPTYRSEAYRQNFQEIEARAFIEKALLDPAKRAKLGEDLARRCRRMLDERIRACNRAGQSNGWAWFLGSGWEDRSEQLYRTAAEVAGKLRGG